MSKVRNKKFLSLVDQELLLISRNLHINESDKHFNKSTIQRELLDKNYFDLINGFEDLFLEKNLPHKEYRNKSIYDFLEVYSFDSELCSVILKKIEVFEKKLKSRIAYFFSKEICSTANDVEKYIDINSYVLPSDIKIQNKFKDHVLFKKNKSGKNFIEQNKDKYDYIGKHDKLPFWVGIKTLTLGSIYYLLTGLPSIVINQILYSFNYKKSEKDIFLNSIYIITSLRNACAHFEIISTFNTKSNFKINKQLINKLNLTPKRSNYILSLFDSLVILKQFVSLDEIVFSIYDFYDFQYNLGFQHRVEPLLERIGQKNIDYWLNLLY